MLPLYLLTAAKTKPVLIELKTGETYNGDLVNCDSWMNLTLKDVIQTSANGDEFTKIPEIYIRGMHIKFLRIPEEIMDYAKEQNVLNMEQRNRNQKRRGGGGPGQYNRDGYANRDNRNRYGGHQRGYNSNRRQQSHHHQQHQEESAE
ncbi:uncharacterized protein J8A68_005363 [[Candida] subhashii]|uniref:LSM complex subunit LSM4 n=1 Tax=[Candida] subhashii TaxID=561895 RepID=A0A8J5UJF9_9ASCO|nr:uncharacterized protein J8A68_005363 [[Candida] subhashii]KAG7661126.1 hypothetical protein J8A68_005363 [[Candida] subhashii]